MVNLVFLASKKHIKTYFLASKALFNHKTAGIYPSSIASDGGRTSSSVRWLPHASPYVRSPYWTPQQTEHNAQSSLPLCIAAWTVRSRSNIYNSPQIIKWRIAPKRNLVFISCFVFLWNIFILIFSCSHKQAKTQTEIPLQALPPQEWTAGMRDPPQGQVWVRQWTAPCRNVSDTANWKASGEHRKSWHTPSASFPVLRYIPTWL